jgi:poly-gamma-glutamate synthase PgsB/CapB
MWAATPDAGVMTVYQVYENQQHIAFVNGFAANDPESTGKIWEMILQRNTRMQRRIAIVNCRADRIDRSEQLAESCLDWTHADHYLVVGTATDVFAKRAVEMGLDPKRITQAERATVHQLANRISRLAGDSAVVMGMGNISGPGLELVNYYRKRNGIEPQTATPEVATIPLRKAA